VSIEASPGDFNKSWLLSAGCMLLGIINADRIFCLSGKSIARLESRLKKIFGIGCVAQYIRIVIKVVFIQTK